MVAKAKRVCKADNVSVSNKVSYKFHTKRHFDFSGNTTVYI